MLPTSALDAAAAQGNLLGPPPKAAEVLDMATDWWAVIPPP
jgi:hypothetical protein